LSGSEPAAGSRNRFIRWAYAVPAIAASIALAGAIALWWFDRAHHGDCDGWPDARGAVVFASDIIVRPWLGRHHVYGVFRVPQRFNQPAYSITFRVRGVSADAALSESLSWEPDHKANGYYLVRAPIMTRAALGLVMRGHLHELLDTCNWALVFNEGNSYRIR
jgi:hypothetical protein